MKQLTRISLIAGLLLVTLFAYILSGGLAYAQDPTIPTKTPVPENTEPAPPPTATPKPDNGGGNNPPPAPTDTPVPQTGATATATTQSVVPSATSVTGGGIATATAVSTLDSTDSTGSVVAPGTSNGAVGGDLCSQPPMVVAIDLTLVHAGPGEDYPLVGSLPAQEERLIVGRAGYAEWWQILLINQDPQLIGWVSDADVDEYGDTGSVLIVDPPLLNGVLPTPGAIWQPTPIPVICTPTPSPTPTATATTTATPTPTATAEAQSAAGLTDETGTGSQTAERTGSAAEFDSQDSTVGKQLLEAESGEAAAATSDSTTTSGSSGSTALWIPLLGVGLIAGGVLIALLFRSKPAA
ncbi:MAG: hypothetical protein R3C44_05195 [Chloroflexota bacterium]